MSIVQPAPIKTVPVDDTGFTNVPWIIFYTKLYNVLRGKTDIAKTVTLKASSTTTTVQDAFCAVGSHIFLTAQTSDAAGTTGLYVVTANGSFTIHHNSAAATDRTFTYGIVG